MYNIIARCSNGQLRLTDYPQDTRGRIEICSQQRWETFYNLWWNSINSEVACRELGFRGMQNKHFRDKILVFKSDNIQDTLI